MSSGGFQRGLVALGALALGGCASLDTPAPAVSPAMVAASPGTSVATLDRGRRIFTHTCTACHSAEPVAGHTISEWREVVRDMAGRAKLDPTAEAALLAYLAAAKTGG